MSRLLSFGAFASVVVATLLWLPESIAFDRYNSGCNACHGAFTDATSTKGSTFPSDSKHEMHRGASNMNTECNLCHTSGDQRNPYIGSSTGTSNNTGYGCAGCHGRIEDGGNDIQSNGFGAGLRQHHYSAGTTICAGCHTDANPADYTPVGEDIRPPYYATTDTLADMPCNAVASLNTNENWTLNGFEGTDNDGDGIYDTLDLDCTVGTPSEIKDLLVLAHDPGARIVTVGYDNLVCKVTENNFYSGPLSQVAGHNYSAQDCSIGTSGTYNMAYADGSESTFFLIVGKDSGVEGSYGKYGAAIPPTAERPESGLCIEGQDLTNPCDQIP